MFVREPVLLLWFFFIIVPLILFSHAMYVEVVTPRYALVRFDTWGNKLWIRRERGKERSENVGIAENYQGQL